MAAARRTPSCTRRRAAARRHCGHDDIHQAAAVKPYLVSLAVGILVGGIYALLRVRSPAPPVIALVGLLGMLAGEQGVGIVRSHVMPDRAATPAPIDDSTPSAGKSHAP
jgi:XapX domain-containing protein